MTRWKQWTRTLWIRFHRHRLRLLRLRGDPDEIARGAALGLFLGFVLPPGPQMLVAAGLAPLVRGNVLAAVAGVWVTNPITMPLIYPFAVYIGSLVTGLPIRQPRDIPSGENFWQFFLSIRVGSRVGSLMFVGLLALGAIAAFVGYYTTKWLVVRYRTARKKWAHHRDERSRS